MASCSANSTASFRAVVKDLGLEERIWTTLDDNGLTTFTNFAYSVPGAEAKDTKGFEEHVLPILLKMTGEGAAADKKLIPRVRQLYGRAHAMATVMLAQDAMPNAPTEKAGAIA